MLQPSLDFGSANFLQDQAFVCHMLTDAGFSCATFCSASLPQYHVD